MESGWGGAVVLVWLESPRVHPASLQLPVKLDSHSLGSVGGDIAKRSTGVCVCVF
jgi:hypothetical protein